MFVDKHARFRPGISHRSIEYSIFSVQVEAENACRRRARDGRNVVIIVSVFSRWRSVARDGLLFDGAQLKRPCQNTTGWQLCKSDGAFNL